MSTQSPLELFELLRRFLHSPQTLQDQLSLLPTADLAEGLRQLTPTEAAQVLGLLPFERAVKLLDEPELNHFRLEVVGRLRPELAAELIGSMSADQRADLLRDLPVCERDRLVALLDDETRHSVQTLLAYDPDSAAGIMTTEYVAVPGDWHVQAVLDYLRAMAAEKETIYTIYLLEEGSNRLSHVVSLRELLQADPKALVQTVAPKRLITIGPNESRAEAARLIGKYNLMALPVVGEERQLLGMVTVDDVIDAMVAQQTRQIQQMGGVEALDLPYRETGFLTMIKKRAGWLCALFLGEMLTATAMGYFEAEIAKAVILSLFIPLIISSGGNSGSQATSLIIRSLALQELRLRDWWTVLLREVPSGVVLGIILGCIGMIRILLWQSLGWYDYGEHYFLIGLAVGLSLVGVVTFGAVAGSMLPFVLRKLGFDPATASAPFVATLVDVTGLVIYFSVAWLVLRGTLL